MAKEAQACRYWTRYVDEEWIIEGITLIYKATSWKKARRVAVIRKVHLCDDGQSRMVFDSDWQYEAMVTVMDWEPIDCWRFYNQRCCMENYIKEAKTDSPWIASQPVILKQMNWICSSNLRRTIRLKADRSPG